MHTHILIYTITTRSYKSARCTPKIQLRPVDQFSSMRLNQGARIIVPSIKSVISTDRGVVFNLNCENRKHLIVRIKFFKLRI